MKTYTVQRIELLSLFKFGGLIGMIVAFLPVTVTYLTAWWVVNRVVAWLQGLVYAVSVPLFGDISVNGVELLNLGAFLEQLETLVALGLGLVLLAILLTVVLAGLLSGVLAVIAGVVFNLAAQASGGLEITLDEKSLRGAPGPAGSPGGSSLPAGPPVNAGPRLELVSPGQQVFPAGGAVTVIGSAPNCDIRLGGLSPHHAKIVYENGQYILYDQSQGKIQVQGYPVKGRSLLRDGFVIQMDQYQIVFRQ